jgi:WD40 repeat protein
VTDIVVHGTVVYSVSQSGVFQSFGSNVERVFQPPFRVTSLAVADDLLLVGGGEPGVSGMVGLYDLGARQFRSVQIADDLVYDVAVRSGGETAALACADNRVMTIGLPGLKTETRIERYRHTAAVRSLAFSPDGAYLASGGLDALVMLLPLNGKPISIQDHSSKIDCPAFSPDGTLLASGARDGKVRIHNLAGRLVRTYTGLAEESEIIVWDNNPHIFSLAWGGRPTALVAGAANGSLYRLSSTDNQWTRMSQTMNQPVYSLAYDQQGTLMAGTHRLASVRIPSGSE